MSTSFASIEAFRSIQKGIDQPGPLVHHGDPLVECPATRLGEAIGAPGRPFIRHPRRVHESLGLELPHRSVGHPHVDAGGRQTQLVQAGDQRSAMGLSIGDQAKQERLEPATAPTARADPAPVATVMVVRIGVMVGMGIGIHMPTACPSFELVPSAERQVWEPASGDQPKRMSARRRVPG
jgi:hypothetical protein